jgi:hypothetical protein
MKWRVRSKGGALERGGQKKAWEKQGKGIEL